MDCCKTSDWAVREVRKYGREVGRMMAGSWTNEWMKMKE